MKEIVSLKPNLVWQMFNEICKIPRPSKHEEKIIAFLEDFAKKNNLEYCNDEIGNVIIKKAATEGKEELKTVVLQSHMDMVCEKNSDIDHDFFTDPIVPIVNVEEDKVSARGTTLGADCGIGMAAQLAILVSNDIEHGPIECLFTVDEETGLSGAFGLDSNLLSGDILLNLDSEDEGELFIGCAGGIDTLIDLPFKKQSPIGDGFAMKLSISRLLGGHSGDDINKNRGNANQILNRFLWELKEDLDFQLGYFDGGNLRNAIPREATAVVVVPKGKQEFTVAKFNHYRHTIENELKTVEPNIKLEIESYDLPSFVMDKKATEELLNSVYACPNGVLSMSSSIEGMVETSTNLASIKVDEVKDVVVITTSQRSEIESKKYDAAQKISSVFRLTSATIKHTDGYPGWAPNSDSEILSIAVDSYIRLFQEEPVVRSIHAGLECGLFLEKYPNLDMISFGPTLRGVHSPDECIYISTVDKFWKHLKDILINIPTK